MIIGICGKSGSGKSTLAKQIVSIYDDAFYVDIDRIGHKVLSIPLVKQELIDSFERDVVVKNDVDRKRLAEKVFNSRSEMNKLTDITWKYMKLEIDEILSVNKNRIVVLDWILLPFTEYFHLCDLTILLDVPYEIRKRRAMLRDNINEEAFDLREKASVDYTDVNFDFVLQEVKEDFVKGLVKFLR